MKTVIGIDYGTQSARALLLSAEDGRVLASYSSPYPHGILPGDLVVVHQQPTAHNGEIVVALLGEEATVKRLSRRNGQVWLLPENDAYSPIDGRDAVILGKVTAVVRQY